ncbi:MAG: aldose 1-epimerase family protein [Pirellulales bacterium]
MATQSRILTDTEQGIHEADFEKKQLGPHACSIARRTLRGGVRHGVDTLVIDNGKLRFTVVPTRGMGLWKAWLGDTEIGWQSPVKGPVHPNYVPVADPGGLGWLEGFDELLCRCGLTSNGAPDFAANGVCQYPLHGRIANRPAHRVEAVVDDATGELCVRGVVDETRFLFQKLRLTASYKTTPGRSGLTIADEVTNLSGNPAELQLLYHINFGPPILDPGAKIVAPVKAIVPRDPRAAAGIKTWDSYPNEQAGFSEQVYFFELAADKSGHTQVLLKNAHASQGVSLRYSTRQLPYFTLWKNTPLAADGYVTGLEPGTNFPNPRSFEGEQGRVVRLAPGETVKFEVELDILADAQAVTAAEKAVAGIQGGAQPEVFTTPQAGWTRT